MKRTEYRIRIAASDLERMTRLVNADLPREGAAFALVGIAKHRAGTDLLVRRVIEVPSVLFDEQLELRLDVAPKAINGLAALCEANGLGALVCHSHSVDASYSPSDDFGERRLYGALRAFTPKGVPLGSLLVRPDRIEGRVWTEHGSHLIDELVVVGRSLTRVQVRDATSNDEPDPGGVHSRQILAFGSIGQRAIERTRVAVVGVGGTGSPTAEQLVRLGVRDLVLVDRDSVDPSTISRVYGSVSADVRPDSARRKVEVVARHLRRINPKVMIVSVDGNVITDAVARRLIDRDVIFLCTDEHWGRSIVNQIAYQYLIPTLNLGVALRKDDAVGIRGSGIVDVLRPDLPCLWCKGYIRAARISAESMSAEDREALAEEGYVEDVDSPTPSVVSLTTTVAGMAVTTFLQLLTDFMGAAGEVQRLNYNPLDGTVRRGATPVAEQCVCTRHRGRGDLAPLLTLP
jgi:molybdopterin-synthase adenylyltransferase